MEENRSWKEKIDPAFDELIKVYLDFIKNTCICTGDKRKRYLTYDDESLKVLASKRYPPLSKEFKTSPRNLKKVTNDTIAIGASHDFVLIFDYFKNLEKLLNENNKKYPKRENQNKYLDAIKSTIMKMIQGLYWEDSRNYYRKRLEIYFSPEKAKVFVEGKTQKELIRDYFGIGTDILCLMFQTGFRGYWDPLREDSKDKKINKANLIHIGMQLLYNTLSIMTYKKTLDELIEEARDNDESLYKAIHLDKTLFEVDWVRKRIRKAFYSGDSTFFKQLGYAIKKPPIPAKLMYGEAIVILASLWFLGLYRLDNSELMELLKTSGVMIQEDPETFRKFIDRLKNDNVIEDFNKTFDDVQKTDMK